jgi:hypothetical protein
LKNVFFYDSPVGTIGITEENLAISGGLTGYAGGLDAKRYLLDLEKTNG